MPSSLAPYVPAFQLRRLSTRTAPPVSASEEHGEGAALLVDVAGFTSLTDRFATRGLEGAEQLSDILNAYFGKMSDVITQHGGDVVLFAGDAVLAVWPARAHNVADMTRLAAQTALALESALDGFAPMPDVTLRHRTAVGAGTAAYFEVGGAGGRWLPLLAGDAIAQLGPTRKLARPGEIILSQEAWLQIAPFATAELLDDGEARLESITDPLALPAATTSTYPDSIDDLVRTYVPDVVLQRLEAGHGEWLGEFRPVVVVFIHIAGVEYGTAGTLDRLQHVVQSVQGPLDRYEGTVYQFLMDDKGTSLVAAFGLPHHAQEHDAVRAVMAAEQMHAALSSMAVRASIGIASGRAFCGAYGSAVRRQYTIVGPVINLASRLTGPAAGGILCDDATYRRALDRIRFDVLPPVLIKGRAEPLPVYRPAGRIEESAPEDATLVGREREQQFLHERIDAAARGAGGVVGLIGEAGIGKSFLLRDAVRYAQSRNIRALVGDGDAMERATSYYIWRQLLARLLVDRAGASALDLRTALLHHLAGDETLLAWAPLLNAILPLGLEDNDVTRSMESEARIESIQSIIVRLLARAAADQPTIIVIDDVHWIDSSSLALFTGVALRVPQLMILFGSRPLDETAPSAMRRLVHWPGLELIHLAPLSDRGVEALVNQRLGSNTVHTDVLDFILQRAEGHPFYTEELALALREAGLIAVEQGECRVVADLRGANFPDNVQAVVNSRIDRLHPVEQLALKTASVIGRAFASDVLAAVYPIPKDRPQLPHALDAIERADLARRETPDPHLSYLFRHAITQDVAYNSLLFAHRRQLHEGIASWYEQRYDGALSALYPLLAHHWDRAEVAAKAIEYLEKAGIEAFNAFSTQECAQFFTRVLEIAEEHPELADVHRRIEWQRYLGDAYQHMTDYHRSQQHFREALQLAGRRMPQSRIGIIGALLKECARQALHRIAPSRFVGSATGDRARDLVNAAVTYRGLTEIFFFQGDPLAMVYTSVASLNCGERTRHAQTMSTGAGGTASVLALVGARRLQRYYIDLAVRYARAGGSITDVAYTDGIQTTIVEIISCRWPEAEEACLRGLAGFARVGYRVRWENLYAGYGFMLQLIGRFDDAMAAFDKVYASARGNRLQNMIFARSGQLGTALPRGEFPDAWVEELEELVGRSAPMTEATTSYGLIAQARLRRNDSAGAWRALETGLALMTEHAPSSYYGLSGFAFVAMTYLEMWERGLAPADARAVGESARTACGMLSRYSMLFRMGRPRALLCSGWYDLLRGREARAIRRFYKGLASARKLRMPYDEALLHFELARRLPAADHERAEHLRQAIAGFSDLGATYDLERAMAI